jgi:hypothetical protein
MNAYQKAATLAIRMFGGLVALRGASGPLYIVVERAISGSWRDYGQDRWSASAIWLVAGCALVLLSKQLGRLFGSSLD